MSKIKTNIVVSFPENIKLKNIYPKLSKDGFYWEEGQSLIFSLDIDKTEKMTNIAEICENSIFISDIKLESINKSTHIISYMYGEIVLSGYMKTNKNSYVKCLVTVKTHAVEE